MKIPSPFDKQSLTDAEDLAQGRSKELFDLIIHFASNQPNTEFYIWLNELQQLNLNFPRNKEIRDSLAKSMKHAIRMFGERKAFADMLFILDELQSLYKKNFEFEILCEYLAEGISVAISFLKGTWDAEGTSALLKRLRDLLRKNDENSIIKLHYARSYSSAVNRFCSDRHNFTCDKLLFEFRMFANKNRDEEEIQYEFSQGLISIIGTLARESRIEELESVMTELRKIASRFPNSEKIQLLLTRGTILSTLADKRNE
ncbi:MAG TPA: hypothetical protein VMX55_11795 [candidate division Zixibacteria bacterium]|nr:hypothetical protein [candidate division Zixibacteria bacterium]